MKVICIDKKSATINNMKYFVEKNIEVNATEIENMIALIFLLIFDFIRNKSRENMHNGNKSWK
jgi:endonuclease III-like uncharacterized protein